MRICKITNPTFLIFIALLFRFSIFGTSARDGEHWRQGRAASLSVFEVKEKGYGGRSSHPRRQMATKQVLNSATFNVIDYGAKGDGHADDTKAFEATWTAACKVESSTVMVPSGSVFLVGPISFSGPTCQANMIFQIDGKIMAATSSGAWKSDLLQWIEFTQLKGITIRGKGIIDGQGSSWWNTSPTYDPTAKDSTSISDDSEPRSKNSGTKPTALRFYGSTDVTVTGIAVQNSPQTHLKFDDCTNVQVSNFAASSPGDSPNTDGIHLQNSRDVVIYSTNLACGDDCVSIQTGCSNIYIHDVNCGPGHGISIGGLGKDNTKACVSNITVRDVKIQNTLTGVRIKTWQGGSGSVQQVMFANIQVSEVETPIMIDQYYCDEQINSLPCTSVSLSNIQLKSVQENHHLEEPFCWEAYGELKTATVPPISCLQTGKPSKAGTLSDIDSC
ncbi:hypothetical protein SLA2020_078490 [Shorea laevis]